MAVNELVMAATLRGASGVRSYLLENRLRLNDLFAELASPTLLDQVSPASSTDAASPMKVGLCIEAMPLPVQRELWSALVRWRTALPTGALSDMAGRFLAVVATRSQQTPRGDPVSIHLATLLHHTLKDEIMGKDSSEDAESCEMDEVDVRLRAVVFIPTLPRTTPSSIAEAASTRKRRRPSHEEIAVDHGSSQPNAVNEEATPVPVKVSLSAEAETRLAAIATQLSALGLPDVSADLSSRASDVVLHAVNLLGQVMNQVHATQQDNEALFHVACVKLQVSRTSDDALFQITNSLMEASWSSRYAAVFLDAVVLPRVLAATSVISRVLLQTILLYAKPSYAAALTDGLMVPLLSTPSIGPAQGEAVTRLLREKCVPMEQVDALLRRSLEVQHTTLLTNEPTILVFQNALNMKPALSTATVELIVSGVAHALSHGPTRESLLKSAKFATLVFTLVSKYSAQCSPHAEELHAIASQLTSLMAKTVLRAIQKLKNT